MLGEMPLAIVAMNVLYMLRCHLVLVTEVPPAYCPCCGTAVREEVAPSKSSSSKKGAQPHRGGHIRGFAQLLLADSDALYHIYAATVLLMGQIWEERFGASTIDETENSIYASASYQSGGSASSSGRGNGNRVAPSPRDPDTPVALTKAAYREEGDTRLLQFPSLLSEARRRVLAELAQLPGDVDLLRTRLLERRPER